MWWRISRRKAADPYIMNRISSQLRLAFSRHFLSILYLHYSTSPETCLGIEYFKIIQSRAFKYNMKVRFDNKWYSLFRCIFFKIWHTLAGDALIENAIGMSHFISFKHWLDGDESHLQTFSWSNLSKWWISVSLLWDFQIKELKI